MTVARQSARSATRAARSTPWRPTPAAATSSTCATPSTCSGEAFSPEHVRGCVEAFEAKVTDGWVCWAFSNHDVVRHVSRWTPPGGDPEARRQNSRSPCSPACAVRSACTRARNSAWKRPNWPSRICAIPTAYGSGQASRAATAAARRWYGRRTAEWRLFDRQALAAGSEASKQEPPISRRPTRPRCWRYYRRILAAASRASRLAAGPDQVFDGPEAVLWLHPAAFRRRNTRAFSIFRIAKRDVSAAGRPAWSSAKQSFPCRASVLKQSGTDACRLGQSLLRGLAEAQCLVSAERFGIAPA